MKSRRRLRTGFPSPPKRRASRGPSPRASRARSPSRRVRRPRRGHSPGRSSGVVGPASPPVEGRGACRAPSGRRRALRFATRARPAAPCRSPSASCSARSRGRRRRALLRSRSIRSRVAGSFAKLAQLAIELGEFRGRRTALDLAEERPTFILESAEGVARGGLDPRHALLVSPPELLEASGDLLSRGGGVVARILALLLPLSLVRDFRPVRRFHRDAARASAQKTLDSPRETAAGTDPFELLGHAADGSRS